MRVILADDAVFIRDGLARILRDHGVEVLAEVGDAGALLAQVATQAPDVAVIDIRMPPTFTNEGLVAAQAIRRSHPTTATLVLSQYVEVDYALKLVDGSQGSVGYLLKDRIADTNSFLESLQRVADRETVVEPTLVDELITTRHVVDPLGALTPREREVLALVAKGRTDRGIAEELFVTRKTVEAHIRSILRKLDLPGDARENRRVHAVLTFLRAQNSPHRGPDSATTVP
jgi:serine/threonine-protein kinase